MTETTERTAEQIADAIFARIQAGKVDGTKIPPGLRSTLDEAMPWSPIDDYFEIEIPQADMYPAPTARMDQIVLLVDDQVAAAGAAERAQMRDVLDCWWHATANPDDLGHQASRVDMLAALDWFDRGDYPVETGDRVRAQFGAAEAWLIEGRHRHVYEWTRNEEDDPVGRCVTHGTRIDFWEGGLCHADGATE